MLLIDLRLDEPCQVSQRLLPTEVTSLWWNNVGHACLRYLQLGPDRDFLQGHSDFHFARQVGVVEFVRVAQAFAWGELDIFPPNAWLLPVVKFRNDILNFPPTVGSK
ncbi:hypothetical protein AJ87_30355 [Rhizobium yanglingense]|nr:hypothetical protein AJ87_30355 [Rhizobium yanglingense]